LGAGTLSIGYPRSIGLVVRQSPKTRSMTVGIRKPFGGRRVAYTDKVLSCVDCGASFTFTAGEQEFHASKGFSNEPRRCPNCRRARKGASGEGGGGGFARQDRQMFTVTCASCGKDAQV